MTLTTDLFYLKSREDLGVIRGMDVRGESDPGRHSKNKTPVLGSLYSHLGDETKTGTILPVLGKIHIPLFCLHLF